MPEGDSLHRAAIRLQPLVGRRIAASSPHPRGEATGVARAVDGRVLESVEAVGKHLLLRFEGGVTVRSHLRMTVLAFSTREANDIVYYPRSGKISFRGVGVIGRLQQLDYWEGED